MLCRNVLQAQLVKGKEKIWKKFSLAVPTWDSVTRVPAFSCLSLLGTLPSKLGIGTEEFSWHCSFTPNRAIILSTELRNPLHNNQLLLQRGLWLKMETKLLSEINSPEMKVLFCAPGDKKRKVRRPSHKRRSVFYAACGAPGPGAPS